MAEGLSVIVPTFNRGSILRKTLEALFCQEGVSTCWDVIVVDDGSTDDTAQVVRGLADTSPVKLHYIYQRNGGAGSARNLGLRHARRDIVLFIDDDIIASPSLLSEHLRCHRQNPAINVAVLGRVELAPGIPATRLNLEHAVYRWRSIQDREEVAWQHFLTGNISLKSRFLLENNLLFDERFQNIEDSELGYRCSKLGLRIVYNASAVGFHNHDLSFEAFLRLSRRYGDAEAVIHHAYPELKTEVADYLPFSWKNSPRRVARDLLRSVLLNRLTVAGLVFLSRLSERCYGHIPFFLAQHVGNYYERRAYQRRNRALRAG